MEREERSFPLGEMRGEGRGSGSIARIFVGGQDLKRQISVRGAEARMGPARGEDLYLRTGNSFVSGHLDRLWNGW
jgi:hypothetical protein